MANRPVAAPDALPGHMAALPLRHGAGFPPTAADVDEAARRLDGVALRTPLLTSAALDAMTGGRVFLKAETLQRTGSFKFRGAYNRLAAIPPRTRRWRGRLFFRKSRARRGGSGSASWHAVRDRHAQRRAACQARAHRGAWRRDRALRSRARRSRGDRRGDGDERGATLVPPYDDALIIAGQGTAGREIVDDLNALGLKPDVVVVTASGGGLTAGIALAVKARVPTAAVYTAEPQGFDDHARSFRSGQREQNAALTGTICDALMARMPGKLTFAINRSLVGAGVVASDEEVTAAVAFAFAELKLVVEPGGAVALAALMTRKIDIHGKVAVAVLSGGNVDPELFSRLVA